MNETCPVPTPAERAYGEIQSRIETTMMRKVHSALRDATEQARTEMQAAGLEMPPPSKDYLAAKIHQYVYCILCDADPDTFQGGRAAPAISLIKNCQNIARHYWGAKIEGSSIT